MDFLTSYNSSIYNNKEKFFIKNNKKNYNIVINLIKINIIKYIKIYKKKILIILENKNINKKIKFIFYKNINVKYKDILKLRRNIFLINTDKGILFTSETLKRKLGGLLILKIIF